MGMQYSSVQSPYSSAPQGKGQGLPNPEGQMSPTPPRMDAQQEMMRRFPQSGGIMKPQNMPPQVGMGRPANDVPNYTDVVNPMQSPQAEQPIGAGPDPMYGDKPNYIPGPPMGGGMGNVYMPHDDWGKPGGIPDSTSAIPMSNPMFYGNTGVVGPNRSQGKGMGSQGAVTFPGQDGQPKMGQPNPYPNTINSGNNTGMSQPSSTGGKSKGAR